MASAIVAAAGALLIGGLIAANRGAAIRSERAVFAQLLASKLSLLADPLDGQAPSSGTFEGRLSDVSWTVEATESAPPLAPLRQVTLTIVREGDRASLVTLRRAHDTP